MGVMRRLSTFSTPPPTLVICGLFADSHSGWCEVIFYRGFDWHFSGDQWSASFRVTISYLYVFFEKSIEVFCLCLNLFSCSSFFLKNRNGFLVPTFSELQGIPRMIPWSFLRRLSHCPSPVQGWKRNMSDGLYRLQFCFPYLTFSNYSPAVRDWKTREYPSEWGPDFISCACEETMMVGKYTKRD